MRQPKPTTIDFETEGIEGRPDYPPVPCGVSIKYWGKKPHYYAWGHDTGNNCTQEEAIEALRQAWASPDGILCHNGKFDYDVGEVHMNMGPLPWSKIHDTLFLLFLDDPNQTDLGLKPSSERLLNMPPDERDEVCEWLVANQPVHGIKISKSKTSDFYYMKYLPHAPGEIVGKYCDGDVIRTEEIFKLLWKKTMERGMQVAYDRERELMLILLEMERTGVPVDLPRLQSDVEMYTSIHEQCVAWIRKRLKSPELNLDSGAQVIEAMIAAGKVDVEKLPLTPTGKYKSDKEAMVAAGTDAQFVSMMRYAGALSTCLKTFMRPWLRTAQKSGGLIFTTWNQVKTDEAGARTGRLSSTPNFQNIPNEFPPLFTFQENDPVKRKLLPKLPTGMPQLPPLPHCRSYVIPFEGDAFIDRDYSQQEPRILGHFDGGDLMERYIAEPWTDMHDYAKAELETMGKFYARKAVKNTNLGLIYGMGVGKLAIKTGLPVDETKELKNAILNLYPGLKDMQKDMKVRARENRPIRTWGGREYYCEPPRVKDGKVMTFEYKMVNTLIQGSAADCTKEAIVRLHRKLEELGKIGVWKVLLNVHDQLTASVPVSELGEAMEVMRETMEGIEFDVPMLSEGSYSFTNWEELKDYDVKGKIVYA